MIAGADSVGVVLLHFRYLGLASTLAVHARCLFDTWESSV